MRCADLLANGHLDIIRRNYRPSDGIRVLMLGESPPPVRGFFYTGDSSLFRFTVPVISEECGLPSEPVAFLSGFARAGFYLDDFSSRRGDKPAQRANDLDVREAVDRIAGLISTEQPLAVIGVLRSIADLVSEVVVGSDHPGTPWRCLHFPHPQNKQGQRHYQAGLREVAREVGGRAA